jgi:uncharacterized phage protein gp47/JayE
VPFARPTLGDLVSRIREDFRSRLETVGDLVGAVLRRALVNVVAPVWAGAVHMLHGHLDWAVRQAFALTADREQLIVMARPYGMSPTPGTFASGTGTATGTNGTAIPAFSKLRRSDGELFETTDLATIASGTATLSIEAVNPGADGNTAAATVLTFENPIAGVSSTVTVAAGGFIGGNDEEGTEAFRVRFMERLREPPQGGADHDYIAWAKEVAGVTRAWVRANWNGLGTVKVWFVRDNDSGSIFPDAGEVTTVQTALNAERPITASVTASAPTAHTLNFTFSAISPNTAAVKAAVEEELRDLLLAEAAVGDGVSVGKILLSKIRTAIGSAPNLTDYTLSSPSADVTPADGALVVMGTVTWP